MAERVEEAVAPRRGLVRRAYGLLLRPEASIIVVSVALVRYVAGRGVLKGAS